MEGLDERLFAKSHATAGKDQRNVSVRVDATGNLLFQERQNWDTSTWSREDELLLTDNAEFDTVTGILAGIRQEQAIIRDLG